MILHVSGVSREFVLVGPQRGPIEVCFSTPKLVGSGGMSPGSHESNSGAFWAVYSSTHYLQTMIKRLHVNSILQWN